MQVQQKNHCSHLSSRGYDWNLNHDRLSLQMKYKYQPNIPDVKISLTLRNGYLSGSSSKRRDFVTELSCLVIEGGQVKSSIHHGNQLHSASEAIAAGTEREKHTLLSSNSKILHQIPFELAVPQYTPRKWAYSVNSEEYLPHVIHILLPHAGARAPNNFFAFPAKSKYRPIHPSFIDLQSPTTGNPPEF